MSVLLLEDRDGDAERDTRAERTSRGVAGSTALVFIGLLVVALSLLAMFAGRSAKPSDVGELTAAPSMPIATWTDIPASIEMFSLSAAELDGQPRSTFARRHVSGGGRQDFMSIGVPDGRGPYVRLAFYRVGSEAAPATPPFVDFARRAADVGLGIAKAGATEPLATRFGPFEVADLDLVGGALSACTGLRLQAGTPDFRVTGLVCNIGGKANARAALGCLLDGLDLNAAAGDDALRVFFAKSGAARDPACSGGSTAQRAATVEELPSPAGRRRKEH